MNRKTKRLLLTLGALFLLLALVCGVYAGSYYPAGTAAAQALAGTEAVTVRPIQGGLLFDGPGTQKALIFYPGAKVEYTAYAPLMLALAQGGLDVFLVKMPGNLAILKVNAARSLMDTYAYESWYLGGHSMGGAMAALYAAREEGLAGLVLLAAYATKPLALPVLEIHGSEDGVLNRQKLMEGEQYLPDGALSLELPGGNHAQFGDYGPQKGDGLAAILPEEQWDLTARAILDFAL